MTNEIGIADGKPIRMDRVKWDHVFNKLKSNHLRHSSMW